MANPAVHWEIGGKDAQKLVEFYKGMFSWEISKMEGMDYHYCNCSAGERGMCGGIFQIDESKGMTPFVTFYVEVEDLQATLDKVETLGGKTIMPPMKISDEIGSAAMFQDPQGNVLGIYKGCEKTQECNEC